MDRLPSLLDRVLRPESGGLLPEYASYVLSLDFTDEEKQRYLELSEKAQQGSLTPAEESDLDGFLTVNAVLMMMQLKARRSLNKPAA